MEENICIHLNRLVITRLLLHYFCAVFSSTKCQKICASCGAFGEFTRRCTCWWGSFESRVDICMLLKTLWNLITVRVLVSLPVNELTNAISREHLPVALNHTKSVHNSRKIIDRVSILSRADLRHHHVVSPIFGTPIKDNQKFQSSF